MEISMILFFNDELSVNPLVTISSLEFNWEFYYFNDQFAKIINYFQSLSFSLVTTEKLTTHSFFSSILKLLSFHKKFLLLKFLLFIANIMFFMVLRLHTIFQPNSQSSKCRYFLKCFFLNSFNVHLILLGLSDDPQFS